MNTITVKPVLIESKEPTDLIICAADKWLFKTEHYGSAFKSILGEDKYQKLVFISVNPKEKIEDGDFHIKRHGDRFGSYIDNSPIEWCHKFKYAKVMATQDQIPEIYIERFVEEYNKGEVKEVGLEMDQLWINSKGDKGKNFTSVALYEKFINEFDARLISCPKLTNGFVSIVEKVKEPILYTEEEVRSLLLRSVEVTTTSHRGFRRIFEAKLSDWFELSKKK